MVKGGRPPKNRQMRSPPPFALHRQYPPKSTPAPNCGITPPARKGASSLNVEFPGGPIVGPRKMRQKTQERGSFGASLNCRARVEVNNPEVTTQSHEFASQ